MPRRSRHQSTGTMRRANSRVSRSSSSASWAITTMRFASHSPPGSSSIWSAGLLRALCCRRRSAGGCVESKRPAISRREAASRGVSRTMPVPAASHVCWLGSVGRRLPEALVGVVRNHGRTTRQQSQEGQYPGSGPVRRDRSSASWPCLPSHVQPARRVVCLCGWRHLICQSGRLLMVIGSWPLLLGTGQRGQAVPTSIATLYQ